MNTNEIASEDLKKFINELRERLFGEVISSLNELDDFFDKHVKSGIIDPAYKTQYEDLLDKLKKQLDDFCQKIKSMNF